MKTFYSLFLSLLLLFFLGACNRSHTDSFTSQKKKQKAHFDFNKKHNRTVEKHISFARKKGQFKDPFASPKRTKSGGSGGKDSFSFKAKKQAKGYRFSTSQKRVVKNFTLHGKRSKDSFSFKSKKTSTQFRFDKTKNRVVGRTMFSKHKGTKDSFSHIQKNRSSMYRFDKKKNRVVSKGKFFFFGLKKRERESGSFGIKHKYPPKQFHFSAKKKRVTKSPFVFGVTKRFRGSDSFTIKAKRSPSAFGYNAKKKRVTKRFILIKHKDVSSGTFGKTKRNPRFTKQYKFDPKSRRVKKREDIWWDLNQVFKKKKRKKKGLELDLFDPVMKKRMKKLGT